jgi:hypothetical protein
MRRREFIAALAGTVGGASLAVPELNGTFSSSPTVARLFQTAA